MLKGRRLIVTSMLAVTASVRPASAQSALPDSLRPRVDAVFARYARPDTPGCAVGVYQNAAIAYAKGYGSANIEYGVPITPNTPFISGSVAKQFTAAAIALLVEQGRLSLDDDVRKFIPELPDYGTPIKVSHLVHHTSGLRDFWALVGAAGMRYDDTYTVDDVLRLAARQKRLNFPPGTEYDYSNTGYVAMGVIVQRVTGKSLREFAAEQIFQPLGMTSTHYHDDHTMPVPGRASAYSPVPDGGWRINIWNNDIVGQGGVMTTIEDLQKWDENFYTGKVGGPGFLERQLQRGRLANGTVLAYAFGLTVGEYRGLPVVEHTGSTGGYRTIITRFPSVHTSVVALCNVSDANTSMLSRRVADVVLGARFTKPAAARTPPQTATSDTTWPTPSATHLASLVGRYYSEELDATYEVAVSGQTITVHRPRGQVDTLRVAGARTFRSGGTTYHFAPNANGSSPGFALDLGRVRGVAFVRRDGR